MDWSQSLNAHIVRCRQCPRLVKWREEVAREKKREFRALWITRINAASRLCGMTYSTLIDGLNKAGLAIDRKVLADLAVHDMPAFTAIAEKAKASLAA